VGFGRRDALDTSMSRDDLAAFVVASRAVNQPTSLDSTLETILEQALTLVGADEGSVMLLDRDGRTLTIAASRGIDPAIARSTAVPLGEGISGYVASSGQPLLLDSTVIVGRYAEERRRGLRSAVCVPLTADDAVLGVLNLNVTTRSSRPDLTEHELEVATLFAQFAASAARNAVLAHDARVRSTQLARLLEGSHALSEAVEVEDVARRLLQMAADVLPAASGAILTARGNASRLAATHALPRGLVRAVQARDGFPDLLAHEGTEVVPDLAAHPVLAPLARRAPVAVVSGLTEGSDRTLAILLLEEVPSAQALETWTTYANHAAFAVARASLYTHVRAKEQELRALTSAIPDPIVVLDRAGRFVAINPAASEVLGLNPAFDLGRPAASGLRQPALASLLAEPEGGAADTTLPGQGDTVFRARVVPVRGESSNPGGRILTLEDVTAAREMERTKADFVAVIGHELRTPLTMIKGYSAMLAQRSDRLSAEHRAEALGALREQTVKLERLVEDLLLVARVERQRPPLHLERHDLLEVVQAATAAAADLHAGHRFDLSFPEPGTEVELDATKLQQVLHHLVDNACKFSQPDSTVRVEARAEGDEVVVAVTDDGVGIFSGDVPTLFERFRQVDGSATRRHGGTGVGLHICKTLVDAHGGMITVRSALGRGTTVTVRLPRHGAAEQELVRSAAS
jgi:signal transduction histidine kinase